MAKKKFYAVKQGKKTGVFNTWDECKEQINGYSGAVYKGFLSYQEASDFLGNKADDKMIDQNNKNIDKKNKDINRLEAYVDGSYSKELHKYSYGCVILSKDNIVKLNGVGNNNEYTSMRNVAGEILGAMEAVRWAHNNEFKSIMIYHDYEGIERWANGNWKANKEGTKEYANFIKQYRNYMDIYFTKVEAHTGVTYNEEADKLAKKALEDAKIILKS